MGRSNAKENYVNKNTPTETKDSEMSAGKGANVQPKENGSKPPNQLKNFRRPQTLP